MKKTLCALLLVGATSSCFGVDFEERVCILYNEAGKARVEGRLGWAKVLDDKLTQMLRIRRISVSSCPKKYQEYGWKAQPEQPHENGGLMNRWR